MKTRHAKEQGIVLVSALIILTSLTLIVVTVAFRNSSNELMSASQRDSVKAMTIAESGIENGFAVVRKDYVKYREFQVDELTPYISSPLMSETLSGGSFSVTTPVVDTHYVVMNALGSYRGAEREIEIILSIDGNSTFRYAILTEDDIISLEGQPNITGPFANIHTNSNLHIQGNPTVAGEVSASGTVTSNGNPDLGNEVSGAGAVDIPHVYPPDYLQFATHIFTGDCRVETPEGALIADLSGGAIWHGWGCTVNSHWIMSGNVPEELMEAFYYVEGNVRLQGNPNGMWFATFVAEGYIDVSGNADYRPWGSKIDNNTGDHSANEILFLAGNDLRITGTPSQIVNGIMAAHMEVQVAGNSALNGSLIAENGRYVEGQEVTSGQAVVDLVTQNSFEGSMTMTANGTAILGGGNPVKVSGWRELVH